MRKSEEDQLQTGKLVQNRDIYGVQRPSVEWSRDITETDRIFNLVLNYDEPFTGHIDDLISSARQIITNHRARTASQMETEETSLTTEGSHNCQLIYAHVKRPRVVEQDNNPALEQPVLIKTCTCQGVDPRIELAARLRRVMEEYNAAIDNNLDVEIVRDLHNTMIALTMQLHADDPISDESAYLTRDDPNYSRPTCTVASYETLSPTRNPPILYYYSDDDDNEEQSTDYRDDINETVIPSSLTADTIPEEDEETESSVDSKPIMAERHFYFMESCLTTQQML